MPTTATSTVSVVTTTVFLLIHLTITTTTTTSTPILGLDTFLSQKSRHDPQATNDTFLHLTSALKKSLSSNLRPPPTTASLLSLKISIPVHVKLVGPSSNFPSTSPNLLLSFLSAAVSSDHFHVITPFLTNSDHRLSVSHSLTLDVSLSSPSLSSKISDKIKSEIVTTPAPIRSKLVSISYNSIDSIIKHDFEKEKSIQSVYIYLLNLGSQLKPYAYRYTDTDSSAGVTKCSGSIWTGSDRYLWIDLSAGPVDYGPALSGDGVLPRGEVHPLTAVHGRPKSQKALLADMASLIWSAYKLLLVPSLRIPVLFENSLIVQFIHIHGPDKDSKGLDFNVIEKSFTDEDNHNGLLFGHQSLSFKNYEIDLAECSICSFAISLSITSYTSRYLFDNYTLIVSEYLDSKRLHQTMSESQDEIRRLAKLPEEDFGRVLPVYIFDLEVNSIMLLDRYHQSVAFKDMVIAVRTKNTQTVSDYSCNSRYVFTQTRELERPLVGSILQSMWGVSPTHLVWSPQHNSTLVDYTWSVGHTPFGPFSELSTLSFIQKDAARRNALLTTLNYTITSAIDVLESVAAHGGERKLLPHNQLSEFLQRWNLFKYKIDKVVSSLSHLDFEMGLYYLRSSDHDLYAIHSLVYHASQDLEASLVCFEDPPFPWASFSMSVGIFIFLVFAYSQRDKLFSNKRKQF